MSNVATAAPAPVRVPDVLSAPEHEALLDWVLSLEPRVGDSTVAGGVVNRGVRNSLSIKDDRVTSAFDALRERLEALLPGLAEALAVAPFEPERIDFDVVIYNDGAFYEPHMDVATGTQADGRDRMITAVYYLHAEPKRYSGGALRLYAMFPGADGERAFVDIEPEQNGLVAFQSFLLHEVRPVSCPSGAFRDSRFAINAWFVRARPGVSPSAADRGG